jgi:hypothetical protein
METLKRHIADVLSYHTIQGAGAGRIKCRCGDQLPGCNAYDAHDLHVAERLIDELGLRQERGGPGDSTYDQGQSRVVSRWATA